MIPDGSIIALRLPAGCPLPVVHGRWKRLQEGEIQAEYTEEELRLCLQIVGELSLEGAMPGMSTSGRTTLPPFASQATRNEQLYMAGVIGRGPSLRGDVPLQRGDELRRA